MNNELVNYIVSQLKAGVAPDDIVIQLKIAGWTDAAISDSFKYAQFQLNPTPQVEVKRNDNDIKQLDSSVVQNIYPERKEIANKPLVLPTSGGVGKIKAGWMIFKQCVAIINKNPSLWRYMIMASMWEVLITTSYVLVIVYDVLVTKKMFIITDEGYEFNAFGAIFAISLVYLLTVIICFYITALSAHVISIFRGQKSTYRQNISRSFKKLPSIMMFAAISTLVGYVLRAIEKRSKIIGAIISNVLGLLWSLATTFSLPIIADSENNSSHPIKDSVSIFKKAWGETVSSRVIVGGIVMVLYLFIMFPAFIFFMILFGEAIGSVGILVTMAVFFIGIVLLGTLQSIATNVLNVALYYYAQYGVIPPSFSEELLSLALTSKY